jgi:hypothetical protein
MRSGHHDDPILVTTRLVESGGDYAARTSWGAGAYGIDDARWGNFTNYASADVAPDWVQDEAAAGIVAALVKPGQAIELVPVRWYAGTVPAADSPLWNQVPPTAYGRTLTVRQYQQKWLDTYAQVVGTTCQAVTASFRAQVPPPGAAPAAPSTVPVLTTMEPTTTRPAACVVPAATG